MSLTYLDKMVHSITPFLIGIIFHYHLLIYLLQLNSYDKKGNFIDAIMLDERYSAEGEALRWSDFKILTNGEIIVNQMEQMLIDDMEFKNGDIHFLTKNIYQMSSTGIFKKVKETIIYERYN